MDCILVGERRTTALSLRRPVAASSFFQIYEGDGGWIVFDPKDEITSTVRATNSNIRRFPWEGS